jgi:hypothetical protein
MARPRFRTIDAPWQQDEEPDWSSMTKADAIREASKFLGGERSAIKVIRFLDKRDLRVSSPQAVKVLNDLYKTKKPTPGAESLAQSVQAVVAIQKFAAEHGGMEAVASKVADAERLFTFASQIGGLEVVKAIVQHLLATR